MLLKERRFRTKSVLPSASKELIIKFCCTTIPHAILQWLMYIVLYKTKRVRLEKTFLTLCKISTPLAICGKHYKTADSKLSFCQLWFLIFFPARNWSSIWNSALEWTVWNCTKFVLLIQREFISFKPWQNINQFWVSGSSLFITVV